MKKDIHRELYENLDYASPERLGYTRRAFRLLPHLRSPTILDVGCGRGGPTSELARLTDGRIIGIDIDRTALAEATRRLEREGLSQRVRLLHCSIHEMDFPSETFDIIWAEASIHIIGFEEGLDDWRKFLKRGGFLVVHEMAWLRRDPPDEIAAYWRGFFPGIRTVSECAAEIPRHGYNLCSHFALPEDFWWRDYFEPLERRIAEVRGKHGEDPDVAAQLDEEQQQVDLYKKYSKWFGSAFFIMEKCEREQTPEEKTREGRSSS
jgi:ubiquinone/menaquinone biosynthesis C-methylase UbiE